MGHCLVGCPSNSTDWAIPVVKYLILGRLEEPDEPVHHIYTWHSSGNVKLNTEENINWGLTLTWYWREYAGANYGDMMKYSLGINHTAWCPYFLCGYIELIQSIEYKWLRTVKEVVVANTIWYSLDILDTHTHTHIHIHIHIYIQGVTGGTDQTSGGCSLC